MCARQWVVNNQVIEDKLSDVRNSMKITYEELTIDLKATINKIIRMIPLENKSISIPEKFEFHKQSLKIRNMNKESISRLSSRQITSINKIAGDMLKRHGYELFGRRE
jgi:hypothetical protein